MNLKAYPDTSGAAPKWATFYAIDRDTYDGTPDSRTYNYIGYGETAAEAIEDLQRLLDEFSEGQEPEEPRE